MKFGGGERELRGKVGSFGSARQMAASADIANMVSARQLKK